jgi:hypothetical protein
MSTVNIVTRFGDAVDIGSGLRQMGTTNEPHELVALYQVIWAANRRFQI